jgi:hypothetical protein
MTGEKKLAEDETASTNPFENCEEKMTENLPQHLCQHFESQEN